MTTKTPTMRAQYVHNTYTNANAKGFLIRWNENIKQAKGKYFKTTLDFSPITVILFHC